MLPGCRTPAERQWPACRGACRSSRFRLKVAVFMLPLLLPVGQNLSQRPVGAAGGLGTAADGSAANPRPDAGVDPPWNPAP